MAESIKNVAIVGASGNVGTQVLHAIIAQGGFNVTILVRKQLTETIPEVTVKVVDFDSIDSLTEALQGQDAVVDASSTPDSSLSMRLIDAAVACGVYRFLPSEFSSDPDNVLARALPPFQGKAQVYDYIRKLGEEKKITWTAVTNNAFLDWGLRTGFVNIDLVNKKATLLNGGKTTIQWTLLSSVGKAVASILTKPQETRNRVCYIHSIQKSQKEVVDLAKQALGSEGWETQDSDAKKLYEEALSQMMSGKVDFQVIGDMIRYSISTPEYVTIREKDDNELLGVPSMSDNDLKQLIKEIAAGN
ncbi:Bifunctional pinoresinol-lariciresinol reductase [Paramyrothecium foliicola]|nr:Bifunctional pinoresinol-lariciresinol reductase [Paramyrothecium foliicola]